MSETTMVERPAADRLGELTERRGQIQSGIADLRVQEHEISERLTAVIAQGGAEADGVGELRGERRDVREALEDLERVLPLLEKQIEAARKAMLAEQLVERRATAETMREEATEALRAFLEGAERLSDLWESWRDAHTEYRAAASEVGSTMHQMEGKLPMPGSTPDPEAPLRDNGVIGVIGSGWKIAALQQVPTWRQPHLR